MRSSDSSSKPASGADDHCLPAAQNPPAGGDVTVRSVEEFVEFLWALEAVFGPDDRPRPPTKGDRFLL